MNRPSNILVVSEGFTSGGLETQVAGQRAHMERKGVRMHLATWSPPGSPYDHFGDSRLQLDGPFLPMSVGVFLKTVDALTGYIRRHRIDYVHAHPFLSAFPAVVAASLAGVPVALTLHGPASVEAERWYGFNHRWFLTRAIFPCCHKIFSVSDDIANMAARYLDRNKIIVLPNGVDAGGISLAEKSHDLFAAWAVVSRLDDDKAPGVRDFIRLARRAGVRKVEVFGGGTLLGSLRAEFADAPESVVFHGKVEKPWERLKTGFSGLAGMGRALIEGAATGLPVCLVGYDGVKGLLDSESFGEVTLFNCSGRGMANIDSEEFSISLRNASSTPERFNLRKLIMDTLDEETIWSRYYDEISKPASGPLIPEDFVRWLRTQAFDTDMLNTPEISRAADDILLRNGFSGTPSDERFLLEETIVRTGRSILEKSPSETPGVQAELAKVREQLVAITAESEACRRMVSEMEAARAIEIALFLRENGKSSQEIVDLKKELGALKAELDGIRALKTPGWRNFFTS